MTVIETLERDGYVVVPTFSAAADAVEYATLTNDRPIVLAERPNQASGFLVRFADEDEYAPIKERHQSGDRSLASVRFLPEFLTAITVEVFQARQKWLAE